MGMLVASGDSSQDDAMLDRIVDSVPNAENRVVLRRWLDEQRANGIMTGTLLNNANAIRSFCEHLGAKNVEKATRDDVIAFVNRVSRERVWRARDRNGNVTETRRKVGLAPSTLALRKATLRLFFKWLRQSDDVLPPEVRRLRSTRPREDQIPSDQLITRDDLQKLLTVHEGAREKAILALLYDTGLRASELCSLTIASVAFDEYGARLTLPKGTPGLKTGARSIRVYESLPFLQAWYEAHPRKLDPKAPLFFSMSRRAPGIPLTANALWQFCRTAGRTAGLRKDVHTHLFRHSAATEKARRGWNEAEMRAYFGWNRSSDIPATYVHIAGMDGEKMELERRGLLKDKDFGKPALAPITCATCGAENLLTALYCSRCRNPVSPIAEEQVKTLRREELQAEMAEILAGMVEEERAFLVRRLQRPAGGGSFVGGFAS